MRRVRSQQLPSLVRRHAALILDITLWSTGYIYGIISRSSTFITSKEGNKALPAEIWLQILDWAELNPRRHLYPLVYPVKMAPVLIDGKKSEPALVCNEAETWISFGCIENATELFHYHSLLDDTSYQPTLLCLEEVPPECPFEVSRTVSTEDSFTIPVSHLDFTPSFLFNEVRAPDVIARLERGRCDVCNGQRSFSVNRMAYRPGYRSYGLDECRRGNDVFLAFECLDGWLPPDDGEMLCPLCIGVDYAEESVRETTGYPFRHIRGLEEWLARFDEWQKSYEAWKNQRFGELGYPW